MNRIPFMSIKKNSFKIISLLCSLLISACSFHTADIEGSSRFSSIQSEKNPYQYHTVVYGESLWSISKIYYNDSYLWPDIYKNNNDKIYDADLILPGQSIIIYDNISSESQKRAKAHSKARGLWVVGYREEADIKFLENN
tara:strand:+ start:99 stop:518 length:420 start_codon:yes stop_codon:yes gene_type:complete